MAPTYPVTFDIARPEKFQRAHVAIRILVVLVLSFLAGAIWWIFGLLYLILPILSAILVSQKGPERFLQEEGTRITGWLRWVVAILAYLALLSDRFPTEKPEAVVRFEVQPGGRPTVGSALLRLIYSIPSAFVLGLLGIASVVIWVIAAIMVLVQEEYPPGLYNFQRGVLRWEARLLGYHASLVDQYPPFALDTEPTPAPTL